MSIGVRLRGSGNGTRPRALPLPAERRQQAPRPGPRPSTHGKFIHVGDEKLCVRGVTYGTFARDERGDPYPAPDVVAADLADIAANGFNAIRTYTSPPRWLLDLAFEHGVRVLAGLAWEQHVDFLESRAGARSIEARVRAGAAACAGHPALLAFAVGNEIPSRVVRWIGRRPVERFVERLLRGVRAEDPGALVTYVNYPTTEYLTTPSADLVCFNVYLETPDRLDAYLARLHNLAGDRPLLLAEIGLDSRAHGLVHQAETLDWQVRATLASGCAGGFVFSWTDEWHVTYLSESGTGTGSVELTDWDFGLTDRNRRPKPALAAVRRAFAEAPFPPERRWPRVSVVVCTYNGARTLRRCLEDIEALDYPDYEVIVVDDGSTDGSAAIAAEQDCRLISTENKGLASARNSGLEAATGEIVAYVDDDAHPDRDWLRYLVAALEDGEFDGIGGPNLPPHDDGPVAECVAESPGGPIHVLLSDREAEHIPGCNMAFRKRALEGIGGFDRQFRVAGDDVDICWRLRGAGHRIGFSPAALVWHCRRDSVRAYLRQQRGYGAAEALLERKWPDRYNAAGQARWLGRLYGRGLASSLGRDRVYSGTWGSEPFQALYRPSPGRLPGLGSIPEWYLTLVALAALSLAGVWWKPLLAAVPLLLVAVGAWLVPPGISAARACFMRERLPRRRKLAMWALTALLYVAQPVARLRGRMRAPAWRPVAAPAPALPRRRAIRIWSERWRPAESRLDDVQRSLREDGAAVFCGGTWDPWDLHVRGGLVGAARLRMGLEEHGGGRQLIRLEIAPHLSRPALAVMATLLVAALGAAFAGAWPGALVPGGVALVLGARLAWECGVATAWLLRHAAPAPDAVDVAVPQALVAESE